MLNIELFVIKEEKREGKRKSIMYLFSIYN